MAYSAIEIIALLNFVRVIDATRSSNSRSISSRFLVEMGRYRIAIILRFPEISRFRCPRFGCLYP